MEWNNGMDCDYERVNIEGSNDNLSSTLDQVVNFKHVYAS